MDLDGGTVICEATKKDGHPCRFPAHWVIGRGEERMRVCGNHIWWRTDGWKLLRGIS